jgi:hypothetical protein
MQSLYWISLFLLVLVDAKKFFYEDSKSIQEVKGTDGYFQTSKKIRVVEFYSPFCVRLFVDCETVLVSFMPLLSICRLHSCMSLVSC